MHVLFTLKIKMASLILMHMITGEKMVKLRSADRLVDEFERICVDEPPDDPKGCAFRYQSLRELLHALERSRNLIDGTDTSNDLSHEIVADPDDLLRQAAYEISKYDHRLA